MFVAPISGLPISDLVDAIAEETAQIAAAQCRMLLNLAELDARPDHCFDTDCRSAAHWLSGRCGLDMATSWEMLRVARALVGLPAVTRAFACGQMPYAQVRALVRIATPETEEAMVEMARVATGTQFRRMVESYRRVLASHADPRAPHAARELHYGFDADGFFCFKGRLPAEQGTILREAVEAAQAGLKAQDSPTPEPGERVPVAARRADALVAVAESFLAHGPKARAGSDRTQVIVHVDAEVLSDSGPGGHCEIEQGAEVPPETARRLACDAAVVALVEGAGGEILSVGRKTRRVSSALDRAVRCRDRGCTFPGCGQSVFTDNHHIEHWAHGGETSLTNLTKLCWWHHHQVHEGGYNVVRDAARRALVFTRPDGTVVENPRIAVTDPHDGRLDLPTDTSGNDRRNGATRVEYDEIMRYFARFDSRLPKEPPPRPPDPQAEGPPGVVI